MGALLVVLGLVGGLAVVLTGFLGPAGVARADTTPDNNDNPYFTLTMSPSATQNLVDGQAMPFTVTRTALGDEHRVGDRRRGHRVVRIRRPASRLRESR